LSPNLYAQALMAELDDQALLVPPSVVPESMLKARFEQEANGDLLRGTTTTPTGGSSGFSGPVHFNPFQAAAHAYGVGTGRASATGVSEFEAAAAAARHHHRGGLFGTSVGTGGVGPAGLNAGSLG